MSNGSPIFRFPSKQKLLILRKKKVTQTIFSMSVYLSHQFTCLIYKLTSSDTERRKKPSWIPFKFTTLDSIYRRVNWRCSWETKSNLRSECVLIFRVGVIIRQWAKMIQEIVDIIEAIKVGVHFFRFKVALVDTLTSRYPSFPYLTRYPSSVLTPKTFQKTNH